MDCTFEMWRPFGADELEDLEAAELAKVGELMPSERIAQVCKANTVEELVDIAVQSKWCRGHGHRRRPTETFAAGSVDYVRDRPSSH